VIELRNIEKIYPGSAEKALVAIDLQVKPGEIFGIIGRSGAGKSTLSRCVNLLERPTQGTVVVDGLELTSLSQNKLRQARHHIAMIFQHFNLLNSRTVYKNVALPLELLGVKKHVIRKKVTSLLELTGLSDKHDVYPSQLSGGQKQRVAIARALANDPKVLLCDEATSSLDPETTASILELLKDINKKLGLTVLLITHEMTVIKAICDRVALLHDGQVIEQSDVLKFFTHPQTDMAKRFVCREEHLQISDELPEPLLKSIREKHFPVYSIIFQGKDAAKPFITELAQRYHLRINILKANMELIHGEMLGTLIAEFEGDKDNIEDGVSYLKEHGQILEEVNQLGEVDHV
jgi:D-methionine transport system ATP-binding protein